MKWETRNFLEWPKLYFVLTKQGVSLSYFEILKCWDSRTQFWMFKACELIDPIYLFIYYYWAESSADVPRKKKEFTRIISIFS